MLLYLVVIASQEPFGTWRSNLYNYLKYTKQYYIYILTNKNHNVLYTGVTNDLQKRVYDHKQGIGSSFTAKYNVDILIYYEITPDVNSAILREKQIKGGSRKKKEGLINKINPKWRDLYYEIIA